MGKLWLALGSSNGHLKNRATRSPSPVLQLSLSSSPAGQTPAVWAHPPSASSSLVGAVQLCSNCTGDPTASGIVLILFLQQAFQCHRPWLKPLETFWNHCGTTADSRHLGSRIFCFIYSSREQWFLTLGAQNQPGELIKISIPGPIPEKQNQNFWEFRHTFFVKSPQVILACDFHSGLVLGTQPPCCEKAEVTCKGHVHPCV